MEEEELLTLKDQQMLFEERRRLEQLRLERLKQREQQVFEEKERLMKEMQMRHGYEKDMEHRAGAAVFASLYLTGAGRGALKSLRSDGYLNSMRIISTVFLPWLNSQVEAELSHESLSRFILDGNFNSCFLKIMWIRYRNSVHSLILSLRCHPLRDHQARLRIRS